MRKTFLFILILISLSIGVVVAQDNDEGRIVVAQWASEAVASSQYTDDAWSAEKALGEPDVMACEDNENAWASLESTSEEELALGFGKSVIPTQVNIYQTLAPGSITGIDIIPAEGDFTIPIRNSADPGTACPGVFSINLPEDLPETMGIIIYLDQSIGGTWNEIDAVELVGWVPGDPAKSMETSLESGDFDMYAVTRNDADPSGTASGGGGDTDTGGGSSTTANDYAGEWGTRFACNNGVNIQNGIDVTIVQQRGGGTYRVTAIGMNGFDPVMAVRDDANNHLCNDDDGTAATYSANLPTTGRINTSSTSSQVLFNNSASTFANITVTVGGYDGTAGEFLLIVEGMISTSADGAGDPFSLYVSPALLESGVNPTAYNIAVTNSFDPVITLVGSEYELLQDATGASIYCDDAGNSNLCWGDSTNLSGFYVSRSQNRQLGGGNLDAMMTLPLEADEWGGYFNFIMTGNESYGDYVAVFHLGTAQEP